MQRRLPFDAVVITLLEVLNSRVLLILQQLEQLLSMPRPRSALAGHAEGRGTLATRQHVTQSIPTIGSGGMRSMHLHLKEGVSVKGDRRKWRTGRVWTGPQRMALSCPQRSSTLCSVMSRVTTSLTPTDGDPAYGTQVTPMANNTSALGPAPLPCAILGHCNLPACNLPPLSPTLAHALPCPALDARRAQAPIGRAQRAVRTSPAW